MPRAIGVDASLPLSDEALVVRARRGSTSAFDALVGRHEARIHRLATRLSRNASDAEEITQEAFLSAYGGIDSLQVDANFGTWLYRIAANEALMRRRAASRRPTESLEDLIARRGEPANVAAAPHDPVDEVLDRKRRTQRVREALCGLDDAHRGALVLLDLEELSSEEASELLGLSPETVRQRARRARLKLRARVTAEESAPLRSRSTGGRHLSTTRSHSS